MKSIFKTCPTSAGPGSSHEDARPEPDGAGDRRPDQRDHKEWLHLLPRVLQYRLQEDEGG